MVDINVILSTIEFFNIYYDVLYINPEFGASELGWRSRKGGSHE